MVHATAGVLDAIAVAPVRPAGPIRAALEVYDTPSREGRQGGGRTFDHPQALGDGVRTEIAFLLHVRLHSVEGRGQQLGVQRCGRGRIAGARQKLLGARGEVREGPGELGRRLDHALREALVGASRSEFIIAALVPMPAGPVRIKAEHFFPFDLDAEGGASHVALQAPQGPAIQAEVTCVGQRPHQDSAHRGLAIDHGRHRHSPRLEAALA